MTDQDIPGHDLSDTGEPANQKVEPYLETAVAYAKEWPEGEPDAVDHDPARIVEIASMRETLMGPDSQPLVMAQERTWEGVFFPALLLCSGWWERRDGSHRSLADEIDWRGDRDLQHWLFCGLEQWAPSWHVSPIEINKDHYLFGQMGEGDEAESLPVIIAGSKADDICAKIARGERAFKIRATGTLCHRDHLRNVEGLERQLRQWGKGFDYCVIIYGDEPNHKAVPLDEPPKLYSGYIWQCVMPKSQAYTGDGRETEFKSPDLRDVYFLWEHTNFAKPSAIRYNLDSLLRKREYVARELGELVTLQKSAHFIDGECALPRERFYEFLRSGLSVNKKHGT